MSEDERIGREKLVNEAMSWLGTKFQNGARIKGVGAECGSFIADVYAVLGITANYELPKHNVQWHLHKDSPSFDPNMYIREIEKFGKEIPGSPLPGDVVIFWWGHAYSHGGIAINWPTKLIHCFPAGGVQYVDATNDPFLRRYRFAHPPKFYSAWAS